MNNEEFNKRVKEADTVILNLIRQNKICSLSEQEKIRFMDFYKKQADLSLVTADLLYNISINKSEKDFHKLKLDYESYLWVINASYYSMFYMINALLAHKNKRILEKQGIHKFTAHAFVYYFIKNNFLAKEFYEQFIESQNEASTLLNIEDFQAKAIELANKYFNESDKRSKFTYEINDESKKNYALTSLNRAKEFVNEIEKIISL
jgi:uncharacterized protein (UPF0332 family)